MIDDAQYNLTWLIHVACPCHDVIEKILDPCEVSCDDCRIQCHVSIPSVITNLVITMSIHVGLFNMTVTCIFYQ